MQIVEALEKGDRPWSAGWTDDSGPKSLPRRWSGESYQGVNVVILWMAAIENGFASSRWFTYRQAKNLGGFVRRGEKSTRVVYYTTRTRTDDDGEEVERRIMKNFRVFNADQIDDLPAEYRDAEGESFESVDSSDVDKMISRVGASISERKGERDAYYLVSADRIVVPHRESFSPEERFYSVLLHELIHWTGSQSRLGRISRNDSDRDYAYEELVAEVGACFACARLGLTPDIENSAAYIGDWMARLKSDSRLIFKAAAAAQQAADYLLERMA